MGFAKLFFLSWMGRLSSKDTGFWETTHGESGHSTNPTRAQKVFGQWSQAHVGCPAHSQELDLMILIGPFQFGYSMILGEFPQIPWHCWVLGICNTCETDNQGYLAVHLSHSAAWSSQKLTKSFSIYYFTQKSLTVFYLFPKCCNFMIASTHIWQCSCHQNC